MQRGTRVSIDLERCSDCNSILLQRIKKGLSWSDILPDADYDTIQFLLLKEPRLQLSPVSLSVFSLIPDLLFDCSRVLEYAKI